MKKKSRNSRIKTRDYNMVNIIKGATKAGVHKDRKKEADKYASRDKVIDLYELSSCKQCGFPSVAEDLEEFCSKSCKDFWEEQNE